MSLDTDVPQPTDITVVTALGAAPAPVAAQRPTSRLCVLDLLRFIAAMAVLGMHFIPNHLEIWGPDAATFRHVTPILRYGWLGVELFFFISGFVICMSSWGRTLPQFFISRVSRLMPAYLAAVVLTATVLTISPLGRPEPHLSHVVVNLSMMQYFVGVPAVDDVYWTLFVELKFYLLFAIVVRFGVTYRRVVLFCMLWMVATLFTLYQGGPLLTGIFEPRWAPLFIAGMTIYLIHRFGPNLLLWCMLAMSMAVELANLSARREITTGFASYPTAAALVLTLCALMVAVALGAFNWVRWRGLVTIGALTYPAYLLHHQIGLISIELLQGKMTPWLILAVVVAGVLLLSYLVYRLAERPLAKLIRNRLTSSFQLIRAADTPAKQPRPHIR